MEDDDDRGPLLAEFPDGTQIYRNGVLNSEGFFQVRFLHLTYESVYDPNTGVWGELEEQDPKLVIPREGPVNIELAPGESGELVFNGGQLGVSFNNIDAALVYDENGEVEHLLIGASLNSRLGGVSVGFRIRDDGDNLSSYNTITVTPNGQVIKTEHFPGDSEYPYVRVEIEIYDTEGNLVAEHTTNIGDQQLAAEMAAGMAPRGGGGHCFAAGTTITLADGTKKPIEDILPDDWVLSFNPETGETVSARVTRTFTNDVKILLNFFGTFVTPGHVYYCAGGRFEGGFVTLIDILRDDGAVQDAEGNLIRACTGATVGGELDRFVEVVTADPQPDGALKVRETGRLRAGSRVILDDGRDFALADIIAAGGGTILDNGMIATDDNPAGTVYHWTFSKTLPQPEDYVLQRSATSLEEIYRIAEWEQSGPALLAPTTLDSGHVKPASNIDIHVAPRNDPHAYSGGFNPLGRR